MTKVVALPEIGTVAAWRAEARALDFGQSEQARQTINSWVGQTTRRNRFQPVSP